MITEEMMAAAVAEMNEAMLRSLPEPEDCYHEFSAKFEKKMKRVIYRADHPLQFRILQKVASIILVLFLGFATIMAISPTVRASVFGWIREQYKSFIAYYFTSETTSHSNSEEYIIGKLPTEYTEVFHFSENGNNITTYANADGKILHFSYSIAAGTGVSYIEEEGYSVTSILIGNNPADLYISTDTTKSNGIIWCNERTIFYISAFLDESTLISLAESVVSKK